MQQYLQNKKGLVQNVFNQVYDRYDLMNDFMSLGIHRLWKKSLLNMMNPSSNQNLIDVACGTGDIAKLFVKHVNKLSDIGIFSAGDIIQFIFLKLDNFSFPLLIILLFGSTHVT